MITEKDMRLNERENHAVMSVVRYKIGVNKTYPTSMVEWAVANYRGHDGEWHPHDEKGRQGRREAINTAADHLVNAVVEHYLASMRVAA